MAAEIVVSRAGNEQCTGTQSAHALSGPEVSKGRVSFECLQTIRPVIPNMQIIDAKKPRTQTKKPNKSEPFGAFPKVFSPTNKTL